LTRYESVLKFQHYLGLTLTWYESDWFNSCRSWIWFKTNWWRWFAILKTSWTNHPNPQQINSNVSRQFYSTQAANYPLFWLESICLALPSVCVIPVIPIASQSIIPLSCIYFPYTNGIHNQNPNAASAHAINPITPLHFLGKYSSIAVPAAVHPIISGTR
jgi:hypothetical protein